MLRSPDDPKFRLSSRVPAETHRRRPEVAMKDAFSIGIEEEYFLVDAATKLVTREMPKTFLAIAKEATNGQAMGEFLQSQCEVATLPHHDIRTAHAELRHLRQTVAKIAADHGLAIVAAGTHPTADWGRSQQTEGERYDTVMDDLQMIGQRNMLCGLHVHVELPDPDDRVDVMTRMLPYLPLFMALAADRAQGLSAGGLRRAPADRRARAAAQQRGVRRLRGRAGAGRRHAGR